MEKTVSNDFGRDTNFTEIAQLQQLMPESLTQLEHNNRLKANAKRHMTSELQFARSIWECLYSAGRSFSRQTANALLIQTALNDMFGINIILHITASNCEVWWWRWSHAEGTTETRWMQKNMRKTGWSFQEPGDLFSSWIMKHKAKAMQECLENSDIQSSNRRLDAKGGSSKCWGWILMQLIILCIITRPVCIDNCVFTIGVKQRNQQNIPY